MLTVEPLSRFPALKPTIRAWLLAEWPGWYGQGGSGDLTADVEAFARSDASLPVGFVVFDDDEPLGFGTLKQESIPSHQHLWPWAATGYVLPQHRRQGVGAFMLQAIVAHARAMGYAHVYCGTRTAASLMQRAGWLHVDEVVHAGEPLGIFRSGP
jgi:GNAT superfamily N-acetyltransferase